MGDHADAHDGELGDLAGGTDGARAELLEGLADDRFDAGEFGGGHREGQVGFAVLAQVLDDHVDAEAGLAEVVEEGGERLRAVRQVVHRDAGLQAVEGDAGDGRVFKGLVDGFHDGTGLVVEGGTDLEGHVVFLRELHGARLHDLGAAGGELEHLLVGDLRQLARVEHDAGVGGVDAVDVGVDLAEVGLDGGGDRDGGEVRAAAAEGGDFALVRAALEAGDHDDLAFVEAGEQVAAGDAGDAGAGVDVVREDAGLGARAGDGRDADGVEGHDRQGDGLLFADGHQDVHLALVGELREGLGAGDEVVGHAAAGGHDHDDAVALRPLFLDLGRDVLDAVDVADGSAAVFLDDEGHRRSGFGGEDAEHDRLLEHRLEAA